MYKSEKGNVLRNYYKKESHRTSFLVRKQYKIIRKNVKVVLWKTFKTVIIVIKAFIYYLLSQSHIELCA